MMNLRNMLAVGVGALACLSATGATARTTFTRPVAGYCATFVEGEDWTTALNQPHWAGRVKNSECFFDWFPVGEPLPAPRAHVGYMRAYYLRRAGIHRKLDSIGAQVAFVAGTGIGFATKAGAATTLYWGIATVAPAYVSHFFANAPVQNLYVGGASALDAITGRYQLLSEYGLSDRVTNERNARLGKMNAACAQVRALQGGIGAWKRVEAAGDGLRVEIGRVVGLCDAADRGEAQLRFFETKMTAYAGDGFGLAYREDVKRLDERVMSIESDLSPTPGSALSAVVSVPLQAAVSALTGQDTKGALDTLKTQSALTGLTSNLSGIWLPTLPSPLKTDDVVSADARRSIAAFSDKTMPTRNGAKLAGDALELAIATLNDYALAYNFDLTCATEVRSLALFSKVTVSLDPKSAAITAALSST